MPQDCSQCSLICATSKLLANLRHLPPASLSAVDEGGATAWRRRCCCGHRGVYGSAACPSGSVSHKAIYRRCYRVLLVRSCIARGQRHGGGCVGGPQHQYYQRCAALRQAPHPNPSGRRGTALVLAGGVRRQLQVRLGQVAARYACSAARVATSARRAVLLAAALSTYLRTKPMDESAWPLGAPPEYELHSTMSARSEPSCTGDRKLRSIPDHLTRKKRLEESERARAMCNAKAHPAVRAMTKIGVKYPVGIPH